MVSRKTLVRGLCSVARGFVRLRAVAAVVFVVVGAVVYVGVERDMAVDPTARRKAMANRSGVFSLEDLMALGQTGDLKTDLKREGRGVYLDNITALERFNEIDAANAKSRAAVPKNLASGYYATPGSEGAEYYDASNGNVSPELAKWLAANEVTRDKFTDVGTVQGPYTGTGAQGGYEGGYLDSGDTGDAFRASNGQQDAMAYKSIFDAAKAAGGTPEAIQDAQDRVLGIGKYQKFLTDAAGQRIGIDSAVGSAHIGGTGGEYRDLRGNIVGSAMDPAAPGATAGAFDRLGKITGKTPEELQKDLGLGAKGPDYELNNPYVNEGKTFKYADYWQNMADAAAANAETNSLKQQGLKEIRASRGLDTGTGISDTEKKRIYETYNQITDPAEKAAFLRYQDPGNLVPELRAGQFDTKAPERKIIDEYEAAHPTIEYNTTGKYGQPQGMQTKLTSGGASFSDAATGRDVFVSGVPKKIELMTARRSSVDKWARGIGGFTAGVTLGAISGGMLGAVVGGYVGAGGPVPNSKNISFSNAKGWGEWKSNGPKNGIELKELGTALAFAKLSGSGIYGKGNMGGAPVLTGPQRAML